MGQGIQDGLSKICGRLVICVKICGVTAKFFPFTLVSIRSILGEEILCKIYILQNLFLSYSTPVKTYFGKNLL